MNALQILVADDHDIVRTGLCALLRAQPGWEIAAQARDGSEAVKMATECKPDVAVLDFTMPGLNGLEAARQINKATPQTKVLLLTMHAADALIAEALQAGVRGLVLKTDASEELIGAVNALAHNKTFFTHCVTQVIADEQLKSRAKNSEAANDSRLRYQLTPRQREIVQMLAEGNSSKQVATILNISVKTVETHRANIFSRLKCNGMTGLVRYAIRNHIIEA